MHHPSLGRAMLRNVLVAALLSVPSALVVFALVARLMGAGDGSGLLDLSVLFPWFALLTALGAALFTFGLEIARRSGVVLTRARAMLFAPLVLLPWVAVPARGLLIYPPFIVGMLVGLGVLVAAANLPSEPSTGGPR